MDVVGLFFLCLFVVIIVVPFIAGVVAFFVMRGGGVRAVTEPSCAACRAPVGDAENLECSRCGADLREVGLITPRSQRRITPWMAVLIWTAMMPLPTFVLMVATTMLGPRHYSYNDSRHYTPTGAAFLKSIDVAGRGSEIRWPWQGNPPTRANDRATVTIDLGGGSQTVLQIDHEQGTYRHAVPGGGEKMGRGTVSADNVLRWWRDTGAIEAGPDAVDADTAALAADVATIAQASGTHSPPMPPLATLNSLSSGSGSGGGSVMWVPLSALGLCALAWIVGCIVFARRCRR